MSSTTLSAYNLTLIADDLLGIPYTLLGRNPKVGLDCWGLVIEFYKRMGVTLEDPVSGYTKDWWKEQDFVSAYADRQFDKIGEPEAAAVITLKIAGSKVDNHMAVMLSDTEVLNSHEHIGVHRLKLYALNSLNPSFHRCRNIKIVP